MKPDYVRDGWERRLIPMKDGTLVEAWFDPVPVSKTTYHRLPFGFFLCITKWKSGRITWGIEK